MNITLTPEEDERITGAYKALDELMEKYKVDIFYDENMDYFFDIVRPEKPKLRIIDSTK